MVPGPPNQWRSGAANPRRLVGVRALIGLLAFGCVSLAVAQQAPAGPKRYALVIGNGTYQHLPKAPTALKNAEAEADDVKARTVTEEVEP